MQEEVDIIEELLQNVQGPQRYIGGEVNAVKKEDGGRVKFALVYPDTYEIGMSHLGSKILYHILNETKNVVCERVFAPWVDVEKILLKKKIHLFSLESKRPLCDFDIVGFSLQSELTYTNVLNILQLSNIPLLSIDRGEKDPFVIAGGPCCANPAPLSSFIDAFVIGEGEEVIKEIVEVFLEVRGKRERVLEAFSKIEGVYVPLFPKRTKKRIVKELDKAPFPTSQIVPFLEIVHDRAQVEVQRGCGGGCRFCQAGMIYRPVRTRSIERIKEIVEEIIKHTGFEEISLLSLNFSDIPFAYTLFCTLLPFSEKFHVSFSLPSLRMQKEALKIAHLTAFFKKTSLTFAPEVATEKLQCLINKKIEKEEMLRTISEAKKLGWQKMKLYFMIGLPKEEQEDIEEMIRLIKECKRVFNGALNVHISCFVPKPHTPLQWAPFIEVEEAEERLSYIKRRLSRICIVRWQSPYTSLLEAILCRGDEKLKDVLLNALKMGARFDGWGECVRFDIWREAFSKCGIDPSFYTRAHHVEEPLAWDDIDFLIKKDFLKKEWNKAMNLEETPSCKEMCSRCGVCEEEKHKEKNLLFSPVSYHPPKRLPSIKKVRIKLTKKNILKYISCIDFLRMLKRACRRKALPVAVSSGFSPQLKISLSHALPLGVESEAEFADIELYHFLSPEEVMEALNESLPDGAMVLKAKDVPLHSRSVEEIATHSLFLLRLDKIKEKKRLLSFIQEKMHKWVLDAMMEEESLFVYLSHSIGLRKFLSLLPESPSLYTIKRCEQFCLLSGKLLPVIEVI